jgi:hypothetical protein
LELSTCRNFSKKPSASQRASPFLGVDETRQRDNTAEQQCLGPELLEDKFIIPEASLCIQRL